MCKLWDRIKQEQDQSCLHFVGTLYILKVVDERDNKPIIMGHALVHQVTVIRNYSLVIQKFR